MTCTLLQFSLGEGCEGEEGDEASMPLADVQWAVADSEEGQKEQALPRAKMLKRLP
jgi:hypothetical protein